MIKKKCVLILLYFGEFNNYFPLFLKSCEANQNYDWLLFTDNTKYYDYPSNMKVIETTLIEVKKIATQKFEFDVALDRPYKLCDYKPAYGFLFEEYISEYEYWGHCDCDLIFGNLEAILTPLLNEGYDKVFAAGHLTIYKNSEDNNRRFMHAYNERLPYKEAFSTNDIYVFDEDVKNLYNTNACNVHTIFLNESAKIWSFDLSMNTSTTSGAFIREYYDPSTRMFVKDQYIPQRFFWNKGTLVAAHWDLNKKKIVYVNYLYMHLQMRHMRIKGEIGDWDCFEILPDRFVMKSRISSSKSDMHLLTIRFSYLYWYDIMQKKFRKKLKSIESNREGT